MTNALKYLVVVDQKYIMLLDTSAHAGLPEDTVLDPFCTDSINHYNVLYHPPVFFSERLLVSNTARLLKRLTNNTPILVKCVQKDAISMASNLFCKGEASPLDGILLFVTLVKNVEDADSIHHSTSYLCDFLKNSLGPVEVPPRRTINR